MNKQTVREAVEVMMGRFSHEILDLIGKPRAITEIKVREALDEIEKRLDTLYREHYKKKIEGKFPDKTALIEYVRSDLIEKVQALYTKALNACEE